MQIDSTYVYLRIGNSEIHGRRERIFLTRVLGHLLDMFRLTLQTYTYESAIQRFTQGGDAIFFDACPGPPASYVHIDSPYVNSRIGNSEIHARWRRNFFSRVLGHLLDMFRLRVHTYTYGVAIQRFTEGGDAFFFDARSGPPA